MSETHLKLECYVGSEIKNCISDGEITFCGSCNTELLIERIGVLEAELSRLSKLPHSYDAPWEVCKACRKLGL